MSNPMSYYIKITFNKLLGCCNSLGKNVLGYTKGVITYINTLCNSPKFQKNASCAELVIGIFFNAFDDVNIILWASTCPSLIGIVFFMLGIPYVLNESN